MIEVELDGALGNANGSCGEAVDSRTTCPDPRLHPVENDGSPIPDQPELVSFQRLVHLLLRRRLSVLQTSLHLELI